MQISLLKNYSRGGATDFEKMIERSFVLNRSHNLSSQFEYHSQLHIQTKKSQSQSNNQDVGTMKVRSQQRYSPEAEDSYRRRLHHQASAHMYKRPLTSERCWVYSDKRIHSRGPNGSCRLLCAASTTATGLSTFRCYPFMTYAVFLCDDHPQSFSISCQMA